MLNLTSLLPEVVKRVGVNKKLTKNLKVELGNMSMGAFEKINTFLVLLKVMCTFRVIHMFR